MADDKIIDDWETAFDHLRDARDHLKSQMGKPGEKAAQMDHDRALDAYVKATEEIPDT